MKKYIVITSIFEPTVAIHAFSKLNDYRIIVVGDQKTPEWGGGGGGYFDNVDFISIKKQEISNFKLARILPYNHYSRKMLGYLEAIKEGADYIVDSDDDNIPKKNWDFPNAVGNYDCIAGSEGFINIYQYFTDQKIWPRGLPLNLINTKFDLDGMLVQKKSNVGVWQGLADEDPDVDAVYRLTSNMPCYFKERKPVVLSKGIISPFNSQNTLITKKLFPLLYLPAYVTFRFTDILRGLIAQPIMWLNGYELGFLNATVIQKRNPHDYMKDFISEIPMYQYIEEITELVSKSIIKSNSIECNLFSAYNALLNENIVCVNEMKTLETWLNDLG